MREITFRDRFRYKFDQIMSKGTIALIGCLAVMSVALIVSISGVVVVTGIAPQEDGRSPAFSEIAWGSLMRTLDAGTMGGDKGSWTYLFAMLAVTMGGVFIVSTLIGVLTSGIEARIEELRKGRSRVIEDGHVVILGWTPQIFTIISELIEANQNQKSGCIVILADRDKVEMDDEVASRIEDLKNTSVVCRTGSPTDPQDIEMVSPDTAKAFVVLSPEGDNPDAEVIKSLLAITNSPDRRPQPYHIVAQIREARNVGVAKMVGKSEVEVVLSGDLIARIAVQTSRQSGLSIVVTELLDFGGDEIYMQEEPKVVGKAFGDVLHMYEDSAIIGIVQKDGTVKLKPKMDHVMGQGEQVIAVSEDDDTVKVSDIAKPHIDEGSIRKATPAPAQPEQTLILGWNAGAIITVRELDNYVPAGSTTLVVADAEGAEDELATLTKELKKQKVEFRKGDTTDRTLLDELAKTGWNHVMVLSYSDTLDPNQADARTLITLLHLREIATTTQAKFSIVSEMVDVRNRALAEATQADDFIVSDRLVSLLMSQVTENKRLARVFEDLFDADGSELALRPAEDFIATGTPVNFYTVVESARRQDMIALGYKQKRFANDASKSYGVVVNPEKSEKISFEPGDKVLVLVEE